MVKLFEEKFRNGNVVRKGFRDSVLFVKKIHKCAVVVANPLLGAIQNSFVIQHPGVIALFNIFIRTTLILWRRWGRLGIKIVRFVNFN